MTTFPLAPNVLPEYCLNMKLSIASQMISLFKICGRIVNGLKTKRCSGPGRRALLYSHDDPLQQIRLLRRFTLHPVNTCIVEFAEANSCFSNRVLRTRLQVQLKKHCVLLSFRPMAENPSHPLCGWVLTQSGE